MFQCCRIKGQINEQGQVTLQKNHLNQKQIRHKQHETVNCDSRKKQDTKNILTNNSDTTLRNLNEFLRLCT